MQQRRLLTLWRDPIKGLAILWVCFFHAKLRLETVPVIGALQQCGYLGVDMLTLLSGFGLYHSLKGSPSLPAYRKRRALRLLPVYLPVCVLWCVFLLPKLQLGLRQSLFSAFGTLTMTGYLLGAPVSINWYVSLLLVTILLAPLGYWLLSKSRRPYITGAGMILIALLAGLLFPDRLMLVSRLPIFFAGMLLAAAKPQTPRPKAEAMVYGLCFALGTIALSYSMTRLSPLLISTGLYWYPGLLIVPGLCAGLGWLMDHLGAKCLLTRALSCIGRASLEIFLLNAWAELYLKQVVHSTSRLEHLLGMLGSVFLGLLLHRLVEVLRQKGIKPAKMKND